MPHQLFSTKWMNGPWMETIGLKPHAKEKQC